MTQQIPLRTHINQKLYKTYKLEKLETSGMHWHTHFQLDIILDGDGVQIINGKSYPMRKGYIIIISPLDFHKNIIHDGDFVSVSTVKFSGDIFYDSLDDICMLEDFPIIQKLSDDDFETAKTLFDLLLAEQEKGSLLGSDKFAVNIIEQLTILALRAGNYDKISSEKSFIRKSLLYIHYNFKNDIKAADVAKYIGYSPNYFSAEFKKETGVEFQRYLSDLRLDFAMKLLKISNLTVTEVCLESGFNTLQHFSQAFKKKYGTAPKNIKKESHEKITEQM